MTDETPTLAASSPGDGPTEAEPLAVPVEAGGGRPARSGPASLEPSQVDGDGASEAGSGDRAAGDADASPSAAERSGSLRPVSTAPERERPSALPADTSAAPTLDQGAALGSAAPEAPAGELPDRSGTPEVPVPGETPTPGFPEEPLGPVEPIVPDVPEREPLPQVPAEPPLPDEPEVPEPHGPAAGETATLQTAASGTAALPGRPAGAGSLRAPAAGPTEARTVGRAIGEALHAAGVKFAFTVPGESFLGLLDGLVGAGIHVVAVRHESAAGFMADAYGQLTGRPAACLGTRAVGAANLAIGIHTARADSTPAFVLVGQVERRFRGREAFQEVDQVGTFGRLAKWAVEIDTAEGLDRVLAEAVRQATTGRPGPAFLSIPEDLIDEPLDGPLALPAQQRGPVERPDPSIVRSILRLLAAARRPVILAGAGVLRARCSNDLVRFAELLRVPVVASWRRGDVFPNDHPLYLGMAGYFAAPTVAERLAAADAMLVLGCRLNEVTSDGYRIPAPGTRWAHVDLAPRGAGNGLRAPDIALAADARAFLRAAIARLESAVLDAETTRAREARNVADRAAFERASVVDHGDWSGPGVHPGRVVTTLRRVLPDEAIVATDAGNFGGWLARGFRFRRPGTFLGPTSGAMGYALPAAIAAGLIHRDRPVVAFAGDGGFAMSLAELETAVRERVRVVAIVLDNRRYGTIRMHQQRRPGGTTVGTDLGPIDFAAVAEAFGASGVRVASDAEFEPALRAAIAADRPTVLHLELDRRWVSVDERP